MLFVLMRVLRVPEGNPIVWQLSLIDRELDEVLRCSEVSDVGHFHCLTYLHAFISVWSMPFVSPTLPRPTPLFKIIRSVSPSHQPTAPFTLPRRPPDQLRALLRPRAMTPARPPSSQAR